MTPADLIIRDVCELSDDADPAAADVLVVREDELRVILDRHISQARRDALNAAADAVVEFDNCGTDADPHHAIPCDIAAAIRALA